MLSTRPLSHDRAEIARAERERKRRPDDLSAAARVNELRTAYKARQIAEAICKVVDASPPLSPEQRDRLALLLRGGTGSGAAA